MLASSEALRAAIARAIGRHAQWGDEESYQLNIFLRYHLNAALAEQAFSKYAPAVARAELIQRDSQHMLEALQRVADHVAEELRGEPLGVPSTLAALLQRSKGEPDALLKVAMEFRQHSGTWMPCLFRRTILQGRCRIHSTLRSQGMENCLKLQRQ